MLSEKERQVLRNFKERLLDSGVTVEAVVAFGSRVRGDATEESDLDVFVQVRELTPWDRRCVSACAWEAGFPTRIVVAPVVMLRAQVEISPERHSSLMECVRRDGVPI